MRRPFVWGSLDCILLLADWSVELIGRDPAAPYRGRYRTALGASRIIAKAGGLVDLVAREFEPLGWRKTDKPSSGCIGVVEGMTADGPSLAGAICSGAQWACLSERGLLIAPFEPRQVWRV